jgi:hypothetical protein
MSASTLTKPTRPKRQAPGRFPNGFNSDLAPPLRDVLPSAADSLCSDSEVAIASIRGTTIFRFESYGANRVKLAADFTGWEKQPIDLRQMEDGAWQVAVELPVGQYSYRFLVDGEWRDDPRCLDYEPNPFGTINAVITVR